MPCAQDYLTEAPTREAMDGSRGAVLLEFGTPWCGHCARARPLVCMALDARADVVHVKVEDGPGRPLGRSYGVKLWPTLIFLRDGAELERLVRPLDAAPIAAALARISQADQSSADSKPGNSTSA